MEHVLPVIGPACLMRLRTFIKEFGSTRLLAAQLFILLFFIFLYLFDGAQNWSWHGGARDVRGGEGAQDSLPALKVILSLSCFSLYPGPNRKSAQRIRQSPCLSTNLAQGWNSSGEISAGERISNKTKRNLADVGTFACQTSVVFCGRIVWSRRTTETTCRTFSSWDEDLQAVQGPHKIYFTTTFSGDVYVFVFLFFHYFIGPLSHHVIPSSPMWPVNKSRASVADSILSCFIVWKILFPMSKQPITQQRHTFRSHSAAPALLLQVSSSYSSFRRSPKDQS